MRFRNIKNGQQIETEIMIDILSTHPYWEQLKEGRWLDKSTTPTLPISDIIMRLKSLQSAVKLTEDKVGLATVTEVIKMIKEHDAALVEYIYDFAWHYGRFYHLKDAEKIKEAISERLQLPEDFLKK